MKLNKEIKTATSGFYIKILDILQMQTDAQKPIIQPYDATVKINTNAKTDIHTNMDMDMDININLEQSINNQIEIHQENTSNSSSSSSSGNSSNSSIDIRYICIRKEHFDVAMIYLKYTNLKKENYIEIIYKSPSIFLDGLFFKTPPLSSKQLSIFTKERVPYTSTITCMLDKNQNMEFINMLKSIDTYISNYIARHARDINHKMNEDENHYLHYESIVRPFYNSKIQTPTTIPYATIVAGNTTSNSSNSSNSYISSSQGYRQGYRQGHSQGYNNTTARTNTNKSWSNNYLISFKSYLERSVLEALKASILDKSVANTERKYIITFNISNIYFSKTALTPLIKCNKCEEIQ
jgi:hypothetical protein